MRQVVDRPDHRMISPVGENIPDERAVYLDIVHRQFSQVAVAGQAGSEIVERELAADIAQGAYEVDRLGQILYSASLGDFETDLAGADSEFGDLLQHVIGESVVGKAAAGEIDGQLWHHLLHVHQAGNPFADLAHYPAVNEVDIAETLGRADEL